ncbi:S-adenosyl-L-methionine-dependent methyltransferase [Zopfochytrium polystomum]|nr:S-adenosyl-L-methionine-dependent methyltransferase [Zopfochytrium polystomum]
MDNAAILAARSVLEYHMLPHSPAVLTPPPLLPYEHLASCVHHSVHSGLDETKDPAPREAYVAAAPAADGPTSDSSAEIAKSPPPPPPRRIGRRGELFKPPVSPPPAPYAWTDGWKEPWEAGAAKGLCTCGSGGSTKRKLMPGTGVLGSDDDDEEDEPVLVIRSFKSGQAGVIAARAAVASAVATGHNRDALARLAAPLTGLIPALKILDLGCGMGRSSMPFFSAGEDYRFEVIGIDATPEMLEKAKLLPFRRLKCLDLEEPWDLGEVFDAAVCVGVSRYIRDFQAFFESTVRHLRAGACLAMTVHQSRRPRLLSAAERSGCSIVYDFSLECTDIVDDDVAFAGPLCLFLFRV